MHTARTVKSAVALLGAGLLASCSTVSSFTGKVIDSAMGSAADSTGKAAGKPVGDAMGAHIAASYSPMMMQAYMGLVFSMAFGSGGYAVGSSDYAKGQYTRWDVQTASGHEGKGLMERAYLFDDKEGNAWWKVKWVLDTAKPAESTLIMEALLDKKSMHLLRLRAKMPNEAEGKEIPVTEATYYHPPQKLTRQSIEGAVVGTETVTVPAGTFTARKLVYGDGGGGSTTWHLVDKVPGGSVKIVHQAGGAKADDQRARWEMALSAYGTGATSELGTRP